MFMPSRKLFAGTVVMMGLSATLSGCHKNSSAANHPATLADRTLTNSLTPDGDNLKIQQDALGKMFLLRSQIKIVTNTATWDDLKPLVVVFQTNGDELGMFAMNNFATYNVIDTKSLIASFKIIQSTPTEITFAWGGGAKFVMNSSLTDADGPKAVAQEQGGTSAALSVVNSFVESTSISQNLLHIREDDTIVVGAAQADIVVDYRLEPYQPNVNFKPTEADPFHHFGFFVTNVGIPQKSITSQALAMHWDMSPSKGPITYAISKYFPASVKQAIKEGVLYWNNVLGPNSVQVVMDVDPEQDFPDRTVVVNWLPWNDAAARWAGIAADPMTGEIINGKVYITSVFLQLDSVYSFTAPAANTPGSMKKKLSLFGTSSATDCDFPASEVLKSFSQFPLTPATREPYINDALRHVVAHEVGHTLGLRHNFAASYDAPLTATQINVAKLTYMSDPASVGAEATTSIMDYIGSLEMGLIGRWILNHPLKYDQAALNWVQNPGKISAELSTLKYCTDEDLDQGARPTTTVLYGCDRFDAPANPLNIGSAEIKTAFNSAVNRLFYRLADALVTSDPNSMPSIDTILNQDFTATGGMLSPVALGAAVLTQVSNYTTSVNPASGAGSSPSAAGAPPGGASTAHRPVYFGLAMPHNWDFDSSTLPDVSALLTKDMSDVGGIASIAKTFLPYDSKGKLDSLFYVNQLKALLSSKDFTSGKTLNGNAYLLNAEQKSKVENYLINSVLSTNTKLFFLIVPIMNLSMSTGQWVGALDVTAVNDLVALGLDLSFWQDDTLPGTVQGNNVTLPIYIGAPMQRAMAAQIGSAKNVILTSGGPGTVVDYKMAVQSQVGAELAANIYSVLKLAATDPQMPANLKTSADHAAFIATLAQKNLISQKVQLWAQDEISLLAAIEAQ